MKKKIIAISLLATFMVVIIHELVPHLHNEIDGSEILLDQNSAEKQKNEENSGTNRQLPTHSHQNISVDESFDFRRSDNEHERKDDLRVTFVEIIPISLKDLFDPYLAEITTFINSSEPEYPDSVILHINTTRGSPSVA